MVWNPGRLFAKAIASRRLVSPSMMFTTSKAVVTTRLALGVGQHEAGRTCPGGRGGGGVFAGARIGRGRTPASPFAMAAVGADSVAEAPVAGTVKPIMPPSTGSALLIGCDGDGQRLGEHRAAIGRLRGAAGDEGEREALTLERADIVVPLPFLAALVGGRCPRC